MSKKIKLFDPFISSEEEKSVRRVLKSGFWASGAGAGNVLAFEKRFQKYISAKECIAVNSGTAALHLALSTADIRNKEVIVPSVSFVSTAHAIVYNGGKPVFADIDPVTLCLDADDVEKKINNKTKMILPVHFAGMPANLDKLMKLANSNNLELIEDAAHACGATFNDKKIGSHGNMVCFSFHPVKNLAMPSGGLVAINQSNHENLKKLITARRWCGITGRKEVFYDVKEIGWNFYMNEFSAAIGLAQLKKLNNLNKKRRDIAKRYSQEINLQHKMPFSKDSVYHFYWIVIKDRDNFRKNMAKKGIETGIHYQPIHKMSMYDDGSHLPNTENISKHVVSIPTHPNLSDTEVDRIIRVINQNI